MKEKILFSRFLVNGHQEVALAQREDKVFVVYVNAKAVSEAWEYKDALEVFKAKIGVK